MDENINNEIMDKLTKVCLCKAISRVYNKKSYTKWRNNCRGSSKGYRSRNRRM